jgi:hypothetical protein
MVPGNLTNLWLMKEIKALMVKSKVIVVKVSINRIRGAKYILVKQQNTSNFVHFSSLNANRYKKVVINYINLAFVCYTQN